MDLFDHDDSFAALNERAGLQEKLDTIRQTVQLRHPYLGRIAVALYESATDDVKTFVYSCDEPSPLTHYEVKLSDAPSLQEVRERRRPRVVNDLDIFHDGTHRHTRAVSEGGYRASYTAPMICEGIFFGFVFFNSREPDVFSDALLAELDMLAHLVALMVYNERSNIRTLAATVKSALDMTHERDPETGSHLERMARFAQLIARGLAEQYGFDDQFVEHIFLFSPLHDLGKISIPDRILLKAGRLDADEFETMKTHAERGRQMVDSLLQNYGLNGVGYVDMLRNIAEFHHESIDGSGYPRGLRAEDIPIEARIVAVADVFDALTSRRPYKDPWSNEAAFEKLREMAGEKLDWDCVRVLLEHPDEVQRIQETYLENPYG